MTHSLASIILITWNRIEYTKLCIQSILEKTEYRPYELIVVDNCSTDGTVQYLTNLHQLGKIQKLVLLDQNRGAGYGINRGVEQAEGKVLVRTDNDMVYNRGWLLALVRGLEQIPRSLLQVAVFGELVEDGRRGGFADQVNGVKLHQVSIGGCNMAFTREAYEEIGPFIEKMFAEDGDYCHRARRLGYLIGQVDAGVGTHIDEPGCRLSQRYSRYGEDRYQRLEELRQSGYDFLWEEDRRFYEEYRGKLAGGELGRDVVGEVAEDDRSLDCADVEPDLNVDTMEEVVGGRRREGNGVNEASHAEAGAEKSINVTGDERTQLMRPATSNKVLYITSGMEQNYPHQFIDQFISHGMQGFENGWVYSLDIHTDWQSELFDLMGKYRPAYVFTLHGCHLTSEVVRQIQSYGAQVGIWLVDDPYDLDESKGRLSGYDFVFTNEEGCVSVYQEAGYEQTYYLPLGASEKYYYPDSAVDPGEMERYGSDLCFVGSPFPKRIEVLRAVAVHFPELKIRVVGPFWEGLLPGHVQVVNHHVTPDEICKYYNQAKMVLNVHREYNEHIYALASQNREGVPARSPNNRIFDIGACQACQLVDQRPGLGQYYELDRELVTYTNTQELIQKVRYYLKRGYDRKAIAKRAYQRTVQEHLMSQRLERMFRLVGVQVAQEQVVNQYRQGRGQLVKGERPAVYLVLEELKYLIVDVETFERLGFRWEDVVVVAQEVVDRLVDGGRLE